MSTKKHTQTRLSLADLLHAKIVESGTSYLELERRTGVLRQTLMAFIKGEQEGMSLSNAQKLMGYFGLEVVERPARKRKSKSQKTKGKR